MAIWQYWVSQPCPVLDDGAIAAFGVRDALAAAAQIGHSPRQGARRGPEGPAPGGREHGRRRLPGRPGVGSGIRAVCAFIGERPALIVLGRSRRGIPVDIMLNEAGAADFAGDGSCRCNVAGNVLGARRCGRKVGRRARTGTWKGKRTSMTTLLTKMREDSPCHMAGFMDVFRNLRAPDSRHCDDRSRRRCIELSGSSPRRILADPDFSGRACGLRQSCSLQPPGRIRSTVHNPRSRQPDPVHGLQRDECCPGSPARRRASSRPGLYLVWFVAPADYQQGETVQDHVSSRPGGLAGGLFFYMVMAPRRSARWSGATRSRTWRRRLPLPIGAAFTFLCLVTGSLWGKPMWGTYWVWDARLTSVLVLFTHLSRPDRALASDRGSGPRRAGCVSILTLVGAVDLPDRQILGRLVEHPASAGLGLPARRADHRALHALPSARDGRSPSPFSASSSARVRNAHRDPAAPGPHAHDPRGRAPRRTGRLSDAIMPASSSPPMRRPPWSSPG